MTDGILKYGSSSAIGGIWGGDNFVQSSYNGLSFCCTPIELLANDGSETILGTATGFFWRHEGHPYLVTNWHVVSGRNPFTGQLNSNGFIPRMLRFYGMSLDQSDGILNFRRREWILEWDDDNDANLKNPPTIDGQVLDLWGFPLHEGIVLQKDPHRSGFPGASNLSCFVNDNVLQRNIVTHVSDDCFIVGYPLKNYDGIMPPIWKRGSLASEPLLGLDGNPVFLVDGATTSGMSGSPIFRKVAVISKSTSRLGPIKEVSQFQIIGVYAGRLQNQALERVNIGYGWYQSMIGPAIEFYKYTKLTEIKKGDLV